MYKFVSLYILYYFIIEFFSCKICGKVFIQSGLFVVYEKIYENVKFYLCDVCGKSFRQKSNFKFYKERYYDIKKFKCGEKDCIMVFCFKSKFIMVI